MVLDKSDGGAKLNLRTKDENIYSIEKSIEKDGMLPHGTRPPLFIKEYDRDNRFVKKSGCRKMRFIACVLNIGPLWWRILHL